MPLPPLAIIGPGRVGRALAAALKASGATVVGPLDRNWTVAALADCQLALLCVPDARIAELASQLPAGLILGHCSASVPLEVLAPHERLNLHPLLSVTANGADFRGAACAIDGSTPAALALAESLGAALGMTPIRVDASQRPLYHAAASMAANYLVTLEGAAERLAGATGVSRAQLAPLVRAALDQWLARGAADALTGPIARGDLATVAGQRRAVAAAAPDLLPLWDALAAATQTLAASRSVEPTTPSDPRPAS